MKHGRILELCQAKIIISKKIKPKVEGAKENKWILKISENLSCNSGFSFQWLKLEIFAKIYEIVDIVKNS